MTLITKNIGDKINDETIYRIEIEVLHNKTKIFYHTDKCNVYELPSET